MSSTICFSTSRFQHRTAAERFLQEFRERLAKFGIEIRAEKTRLIEFGPSAHRCDGLISP